VAWRRRHVAAAAGAHPTPLLNELPADQQDVLARYIRLVLERNQNVNLTAVTDFDDAMVKHVEDSLALLRAIDPCATRAVQGESRPVRLADVGSGAGLPAFVLAVARPGWHVTAVDTLRKRCDFMEEAAQKLGIQNVRVVWARAEDLGRGEGREAFDVVTARAVASMNVLAELCLPLCRVGGYWVAAKQSRDVPEGTTVTAEVDGARGAISRLGGAFVGVEDVPSFGETGQRTAVVVAKAERTPDAYPRRAGVPGKRPLS